MAASIHFVHDLIHTLHAQANNFHTPTSKFVIAQDFHSKRLYQPEIGSLSLIYARNNDIARCLYALPHTGYVLEADKP